MMRRQSLPALVTGLAALIVWFSASELHWATRAWTALLLTVLPALIVAQFAFTEQILTVPRKAIYRSSIIMLWTLAAVTAVVALAGGVPAATLGLALAEPGILFAATGGAILVGLLLVFVANRFGPPEPPLLKRLLPVSQPERLAFIALSVSAGICEEFVFRGFLIPALSAATGRLWLAVALSSGVFGVLHAYQQWAGAAAAAVLGLLLAVPFLLTGSIIPSIIAHAAIDIIVGLWVRDHWRPR